MSVQTGYGASHPKTLPPKAGVRALLAACLTQFIEFYDFGIYGYTVPTVAVLFFPDTNPTTAVLSSLAVFGVAFVVRPLGGIFFGALGDRIGRRKIVMIEPVLLGVSTAAVGLLPTYHAIGFLAPLLLLVCRLLQGFSASGATVGASAFVIEHAPANRRATWVSITSSMTTLPTFAGAAFVGILTSTLSTTAFQSWGWRIPFLVALPMSLAGLFVRSHTTESPVFEKVKSSGQLSKRPVRDAVRNHFTSMVFVFFLAGLGSLSVYMLIGYFVTYLDVTAGLTQSQALWTNTAAVAVTAALTPAAGFLADVLGRKTLMITGSALLAVTGYPVFALAAHGTVLTALLAQFVLVIASTTFAGAAYTVVMELFPARTRFSGAAISYNFAYAVLGGTAPFIGGFLVASTGIAQAPGIYMSIMAAIVLVVVMRIPETSKRSLA